MVETEGLAVGQSISSGSMRLTKDAAIEFAREFYPQPMHINEIAAAGSFFGSLVASGWHALAITMRLAVEARPFGDQPLIGAEISDIRYTKPIPPETCLSVRITHEAIEEDKGKFGYSILRVLTLDADTEVVLIRQKWRMLRT
ncbi:MaoC/PaaZ C-terminal domain-containing protein [Ruegeria sp. A3M17]|uniref:MaoC/PaaZ C-terminal domain-containing protein n=1 Tax=Ruegeria sp. A3M17 TaxID=2267229 RepID=UPI0013145D9B|nr:MaoC/PaaZ C-terminal domain-containing protein [Ruegeria sp. A3M17]